MDPIETVYKGKYISVVRRSKWEYVERNNVSGIVGIVPVTDDGKLVLIEQFRVPMNASVIEFPAGLAGDTEDYRGESLATAAKRELLEEAGYAAKEMTEVATGVPSAGLSTEIVTLFVARGLTKQSDGGGDGSENIVVHLVPVKEIDAFLAAQKKLGKLIDIKVYAGLRFV